MAPRNHHTLYRWSVAWKPRSERPRVARPCASSPAAAERSSFHASRRLPLHTG